MKPKTQAAADAYLASVADAAFARARATARPKDDEGYTVHDFARVWSLTRKAAYQRVRLMLDGGELKVAGKKSVPWGGYFRAVECYQFAMGKK